MVQHSHQVSVSGYVIYNGALFENGNLLLNQQRPLEHNTIIKSIDVW